MLETTIRAIDDRADIEWKYARSKLYMEYIRDGKNIFSGIFIFVFLGNALPVPLNILPSPTSMIEFFKRIKQMIICKKSSLNKEDKSSVKHTEGHFLHINMGQVNGKSSIGSADFKNEKIFNRKHTMTYNENLTYKMVIERVIRRFLLYYNDNHIGLNEVKDGSEFREVKNDIISFRFEVSHQIDLLEEMQNSLIDSINTLNENMDECFDIKSIKNYLNKP